MINCSIPGPFSQPPIILSTNGALHPHTAPETPLVVTGALLLAGFWHSWFSSLQSAGPSVAQEPPEKVKILFYFYKMTFGSIFILKK